MKKQFLNPKAFNISLSHKRPTYLHTDAYVFFVEKIYDSKEQGIVEYDIIYVCGTHECFQFESAYWENGGLREFKIKFDLTTR